ncbi:MAG TPA: hypothetical protein VH306_04630 [Gaiellaceae bacterium]
MSKTLAVAAIAAVASIGATGTAAARTYYASVGPGMTIKVLNAAGKKISSVKKGAVTIRVRDKSRAHNFHLEGPGSLNRKTTIPFLGLKTWKITLKAGLYTYRCDAHPRTMRGSFRAS